MSMCAFAQNRDSLKNLANNTIGNKTDAMASNKPGAEMPTIHIIMSDSSRYNTNNIDKNKDALLVLFNPGCEHCMDFTKMIIKNIDSFPNTQFVFVAGDKTFPYLAKFVENVKYVKHPQIVIGIDIDYITPTIFAYEGIPQIMIYGKDKKLIDVIYKEATIKKLQTILNRAKNNFNISIASEPQKVIGDATKKEAETPVIGFELKGKNRKKKK
jgi:thiol-disulfide isomerase/thioredoxin